MNRSVSIPGILLFVSAFILLATSNNKEVAAFIVSSPARGPSATILTGPFHFKNTPSLLNQENVPTALTRQRRSVAHVQMQSLFGLGVPEIALILVAAVFLLGPQKIGELIKDSGKAAGEIADELKNVPDEFKAGLEEGEMEARSRKARKINPVKDDDDSSSS